MSQPTVTFTLQLAKNCYGKVLLSPPSLVDVDSVVVDAYPVVDMERPRYIDTGSRMFELWSALEQTVNPRLIVLSTIDGYGSCHTVQTVTYAVMNSQDEIVKTVALPDFVGRFDFL